ncbi:MAG: AAA-like domain-containing protein [Cyanobacteria bacterium P01_A01_bin.68]
MPRSVKVRKDYIKIVKAALQRQGFPRQKDLAEALGFALDTVSKFLNGKPIDFTNFFEISQKLGFDWQEIADTTTPTNHNGDGNCTGTGETIQEEPVIATYIERTKIEDMCFKTLSQSGSLLRIKAPGLMGKTSLMANVLGKMANQGYRTVLLNLHYAEASDFSNIADFLKWFCVSVTHNLRMSNRLADYWDEQFSTPKMNCTAYFEEYLLAQVSSPLILCLDEVERIFPHEKVAAEFLGLLRAWHEQAKTRPVWKQLRLVVIHSTEVYVPLQVNESPFNVGVSIELPEFTPQQVLCLARKYGFDYDLNQIKKLMDKVGGHPYLVEQAFAHLQLNAGVTLGELLQTAATDAGIYGNLLRHYWRIIEQDRELLAALKEIVSSQGKVRLLPTQAYKLHRMGLVNLSGNEVSITCGLYREYFGDRFEFLEQKVLIRQ